ncbi:MAG TPA: hypothetical protein PKA20_19360 [Burkholderiaceae bacterium]|nr:hypothetical protein [Burkholderiaceae bacterium]
MATIEFYQKPGCATNARQKRMLEAAGHTVNARSLLSEPWTAETLLGFFGSTLVPTWFNPAAPRIKSGEIVPGKLDADRELVTSLLGNTPDRDAESCSRPDATTPCPAPHSPPP